MSDPQLIGDYLAGPMSRVDGCPGPSCVNTEAPKAYIPTDDGWRIAYQCADCGLAWVADVPHFTPVSRDNMGTWREPDRVNESGSLTAHRSDETKGAEGIMPDTQTTRSAPPSLGNGAA